MLNRQDLENENAKLREKLNCEREKGKQLSMQIRTLINELMIFDVDSAIKAAGQQFLDAKNEQEEKIAIDNSLKIINANKQSKSSQFCFSENSSPQEQDDYHTQLNIKR